MDGIILNQFQRFVVSRFGREAWTSLIKKSEVPFSDALLSMATTYPDRYLFAMVPVASEATGIPLQDLLGEFGSFIAPALLRIYAPLVQPEWRTLDVIEHTEPAIHRVVRQRNPQAAPPELRVEREGAESVAIDYRSERRLCAVAVGIARGIANHFGEDVSIAQPECMLRGDERCLITVRKSA